MPNTREALVALLDERNEHPERLADIDRRIRETFAETAAVFVLDMSGFSRLTMRYGIIHFLSMIQRLRRIACPLIEARHGRVIKMEADNIFAAFKDVPEALAAALDIQKRLSDANTYLPEDWDIHACIGIGFGEVLMIHGEDMFGNEMNIASKLGEDIAERGEVLLSESAFARADAPNLPWENDTTTISKLEIPFHRIRTEK